MAHVVVVMGVAGAGKTLVGRRLATRLGYDFLDADSYHPRGNIEKMAAGVPLTDADRAPWLERLRRLLEGRAAAGRSVVLACSALKASYRHVLRSVEPAARVHFVYLKGDHDTLLTRLRRRRGHFMKGDMLASQLRELEEPEDAVVLDVRQDVRSLVREAANALAPLGVRRAALRGGGTEPPR